MADNCNSTIAIRYFTIENRKASMDCWKNNANWQETLKVKIGARKYKRFLIMYKERPQVFALFVPCLMIDAL